jgi:hypothetical protein
MNPGVELCKCFVFLVEPEGGGYPLEIGRSESKQKVPPVYSHAEDSACSLDDRRDDVVNFLGRRLMVGQVPLEHFV